MKVLQINLVFRRGSTGKIVAIIHDYLKEKNIESHVAYAFKSVKEKDTIRFCSWIEYALNYRRNRITGKPYSYAFFATRKLIRYIKKIKPDVIHVHCINECTVNIYKLFKFITQNKIPLAVTSHAEFFYTGNCGHAYDCDKWITGCGKCGNLKEATHSRIFDNTASNWRKMKKTFEGLGDNVICTAVSDWVNGRAEQSPIFKGKEIVTVENGIDINIFKANAEGAKALRESLGLVNKKVILYLTPNFFDPTKGGAYVLEIAKRMETNTEVVFVVVGCAKPNNYNCGNNVIFVKHTDSQQQLVNYYTMADLTLLTSKRETFSMICAESLSCGTPIVGFKAGGPELISLPDYSEFVEFGDVDALEKAVIKWLAKKIDRSKCGKFAHERYSGRRMAESYLAIYKRILEKR